jgi:gliding motility-associated-like protein
VVRSVNCDTGGIIIPPADSNCKLNFPNAFTPNNDNLNDRFGGKYNCQVEAYELIIVNRWGEMVFKSNDPNTKWDGLIKGREAEMGVYFYIVQYKFPDMAEKRLSGDVVLIR